MMTKRSGKIRFYDILQLTTAVIFLWTPSTGAQDQTKQMLTSNDKAWQVHVVSELLPEKGMAGLRAMIEQGQIVCRLVDSAVLEIPLKSITRASRDTVKNYPAAEFLMGVATRPSDNPPLFGTRRYRDEAAARLTLGAFAFVGLLFPRHKDEIHVFWTDEDGEHGAEFLMGRKEGHAMLERLKQESVIEVRDLEKERKVFEKRREQLSRVEKEGKRTRRTLPNGHDEKIDLERRPS